MVLLLLFVPPCPGGRSVQAHDAADGLQRGNPAVHVLARVVQVKAGAARGVLSQVAHEGLGAVVSRPDGHALGVENGADVVRMDIFHVKGNNAGLVVPGGVTAVEFDVGQFAQLRQGIGDEIPFDGFDAGKGKVFQVVDGGGQAGGTADVLRPRLEFGGQLGVGRVLFRHIFDHVPAHKERRHLVEQGFPAVQDADAHGAQELVPAEGEKVAVQLLHVHGEMGNALGAVDDADGADTVGLVDDFAHVIHEAQDIGHVGHGDDLRLFRNLRFYVFFGQVAILFEIDVFQHGAFGLGDHLPGHEVAVVFGDGKDDFVTRLHEGEAVAVRHEVQGFRGVFREDDFVRLRRMDKVLDLGARVFIDIRGLDAELVGPAVRVGVTAAIVAADGPDDAFRFLGRGAVVQVDERFVVHRPLQEREIMTKVPAGPLFIFHQQSTPRSVVLLRPAGPRRQCARGRAGTTLRRRGAGLRSGPGRGS